MKDVKLILNEIRELTVDVFGDGLVGLYIHGSLAFGCCNPQKSDIDYLAVIKDPMTEKQRITYIKGLSEINETAPEKGIEMSVVLYRHTKEFIYPTPFEIHFSNAHLEKIRSDLTQYCNSMKGVDPDLAAHFTVTKKCGITLYGEPIDDVFTSVPKEYYLDSIMLDNENAAEDIIKNTVYVVLNLCRVLAYVKDEIIISKADGGLWGMKNLPQKYRGTVRSAYEEYISFEKRELSVKENELRDFAEYMLGEIFKNK